MSILDIFIYAVAALFVIGYLFLLLFGWLLDEGFKSKYRNEYEHFKREEEEKNDRP